MKSIKDFEEILQNIYEHASVVIQTNLVDGLSPTQIIANIAHELVLLEKSGNLDEYKKEYIDPYLDNEQITTVLADIDQQLNKKKTMH